jgi:hypothetical protein
VIFAEGFRKLCDHVVGITWVALDVRGFQFIGILKNLRLAGFET